MTGEVLAGIREALADRYTIDREIGRGGMATVYLAEDLKHHRKVAVKVLKPELAAILGTERFLKEIEVTANLQHPHILPLYDSGQSDSFLYYVMPHVEDESLREKLDREKQLSVAETVEIAKSVAAALDYAHQHSVIHRDIKPENILLQTGQALVADFGIALAVSAAAGTRLTETGLSLGTPHYMSPEQATADRELDARSDVYSLGAVVYEMLVGEPPHVGNSAQAIVAKILSDTPAPISRTRELVPPNVDAAVCCALAKSPADRFSSAADFSAALLNPAFTLPTLPGAAEVAASPSARTWRRVAVGIAAVAVVFAVLFLWLLLRPDPPRPVTRRLMAFLPGQELIQDITRFQPVSIASDGSVFVYTGPGEARHQLWIKRRDEHEATPLAGTEGVQRHTVSPDGRSIAFVSAGKLQRIPAAGGPSVTLSDSANMYFPQVAWLDDGTVVFTDNGFRLRSMAATGGSSEVVWEREGLGQTLAVLTVTPLPESRGVLFGVCDLDCATVQEVWALDLRNGEAHRVLTSAMIARYVSTGHLVAGRVLQSLISTEVFAAPFDLETLQTSGEAVDLWEDAWVLAISDDGTLFIWFLGLAPRLNEAVWVNRDGRVTPIDTTWRFSLDDAYASYGWALSPDGNRLAIALGASVNSDIWIKQLENGPESPLTFDDASHRRPRWTPDGRFVTYVSRGRGAGGIYRKLANGTGSAELVYLAPFAAGVTLTGTADWILVRTVGPGLDIVGFRPGIDSVAVPLLVGEYDEMTPELSPDSRWLAYTSNESGEWQVYVRPFPDVESGKWPVSQRGGYAPLWAHSGRELFYISAANEMVAASLNTDPAFEVTERRVLFELSPDFVIDLLHTAHDISPDDQRFIMVRRVGTQEAVQPQLVVVDNWFQELKQRVGNEGRR